MTQKIIQSILFTLCSIVLFSCNDDNKKPSGVFPGGSTPSLTPNIEFTTQTEVNTPVLFAPEGSMKLSFQCENTQEITATTANGWQIDIDDQQKTVTVTAPAADTGDDDYTLTLIAANGEESAEASLKLHRVQFDDPKGTFVLNEGNMTSENGSLLYISPEGWIMPNAYKQVNGTELGNVTQDMCFHDGKIYIISQNGNRNAEGTTFENDGMLVIADAKTLKKVKTFTNDELAGLNYPTHIAALDDQHIYIRAKGEDINANKGIIYCLNAENGKLTRVEGSEGAPQSPFAVLNGKAYTFKNTLAYIYLWELGVESDKIEKKQLPSYLDKAIEIQKADDSHLWVLTNSFSNIQMLKIDINNTSDRNSPAIDMPALPTLKHNASGRTFAAYNETIYYADDTALNKIAFPPGSEEAPEAQTLVDLYELDDKALELYNGMSINPATGQLYVNSIRGVGAFYTTNSIWVFDTKTDMSTYQFKLDNYTHFPAGTFFPVGE